jgi:large subunit ribosomal protein L25
MATQTRARIPAQVREAAPRKSAVRDLRRQGMVPGSISGHGEPQCIQISARDLQDFLRGHTSGALMDLDLDGKTTTAVIRKMDRDGVTGRVIHLGLQRVDVSETIHSAVPVVFQGEEALIKEQLVLETQLAEVDVHGRADQIPESFPIDLAGRQAGDLIHISDLKLPAGITATKPGDTIIARISSPTVSADVEAALQAEEAAHDALVASHGTEEPGETGEAGEPADASA